LWQLLPHVTDVPPGQEGLGASLASPLEEGSQTGTALAVQPPHLLLHLGCWAALAVDAAFLPSPGWCSWPEHWMLAAACIRSMAYLHAAFCVRMLPHIPDCCCCPPRDSVCIHKKGPMITLCRTCHTRQSLLKAHQSKHAHHALQLSAMEQVCSEAR